MYCILVTGIPAVGKSTTAEMLGKYLSLPVISKDQIKEIMYDDIGFRSREEKVKLGIASMNILYYMAMQLMKNQQAFILENNFENMSKEALEALLSQYSYTAITVTLTGDYNEIYQRFLKRNASPDRHRGHVINDSYPETRETQCTKTLSFEDFVAGIRQRGMDKFTANGPQIAVDMTDLSLFNIEELVEKIKHEIILYSASI